MQRRLPNDWSCKRPTGVYPIASPSAFVLFASLAAAPQFKILTSEILDLPSMATDPKFASPSNRVANRVELCDKIERRLREESRDVWMVKFKGKGYRRVLINVTSAFVEASCFLQGSIRTYQQHCADLPASTGTGSWDYG